MALLLTLDEYLFRDIYRYVFDACVMELTPTEINEDGDCYWRNKHGQLHRDGDQPASIWADGTKMWYQNGDLHHDGDQPAIIWTNGTREWYQHGRRIR
jgi:hypothetical protein